jgi:Protein of unknown function (DUF4242)
MARKRITADASSKYGRSADVRASAAAYGRAMKTFIIEREIPGASNLSDEELRAITTTSNGAVASLEKPYKWLHSYVAGDKIYCVHQAEDEEVIREHARRGNFPANLVEEVVSVFGREGVRELPV